MLKGRHSRGFVLVFTLFVLSFVSVLTLSMLETTLLTLRVEGALRLNSQYAGADSDKAE